MSQRIAVLVACTGLFLACQAQDPSMESCEAWDTEVRTAAEDSGEGYAQVAESLELAEGLTKCLELGLVATEAAVSPDPEAAGSAPDITFLDDLAFGSDVEAAVSVLESAGWSCKAEPLVDEVEKTQRCKGDYARGPAVVLLRFRVGRLAEVKFAVKEIKERTKDIVDSTGADVFEARRALIDKLVADLETRFPDLMQVQDRAEESGVHLVWQGSLGTRRAQVDFTQRGPSLGFSIDDVAVDAEIHAAEAGTPARRAESYFE